LGGGGVGGGVLIYMCLTTIVSFVFLQGLETSPCRGGSTEILIDGILFIFLQHQSVAASNHVGGSSASQFGGSPVSQVAPNQLKGSPASQIAPNY
jgi:hypothetical protein